MDILWNYTMEENSGNGMQSGSWHKTGLVRKQEVQPYASHGAEKTS